MHDNEIIEGIIAEFKGLAKHPQASVTMKSRQRLYCKPSP